MLGKIPNPYSKQANPQPSGAVERRPLEFLSDVEMRLTVLFGRVEMTIRDLLALKTGTVVGLDRPEGEPLEIRVNNTLFARGEVVVVNDHYGIRVTELVDPDGAAANIGNAQALRK